MTTVQILERGRERIAHGWAQKIHYREGDRYCAAGAIDGAWIHRAAYEALLREATGSLGLLCVWNDRPGRTQAEVIAVHDAAIAAEKAKEATR